MLPGISRQLFLWCFPCFLILQPCSSAVIPAVCRSTPDLAALCKSLIPPDDNSTSNVYDKGRSYIGKSLSSAREFLSLIDNYLSVPIYLVMPGVRGALEDCKSLAESNIELLLSSIKVVNGTSRKLSTVEAEDVLTKLSAILTNAQTCVDGLQETSSPLNLINGVAAPLIAIDMKLFRLSLALFADEWVPKKKSIPPPHPRPYPHLPIHPKHPHFMWEHHRRVYETATRRKLLQGSGGSDSAVSINGTVVVSKDGSGDFTTVSDAVAAAPLNSFASNGYFLIYVMAGVYEEYVSIASNQKYVMMIGEGINKTIITGNHSVVDNYTTFNSYTFAVVGEGFVGANMTIRNTAGPIKQQAVALRNGADLSTFYSCSFEGYQDTLYVHSQRQFYSECDIYGTVDFIFGNAEVVLQNCNIYPRKPLYKQTNTITAQGRTDLNQNTGISIHNCSIKATQDLLTSNYTVKTYLGRPWKQYSRTVYMQSYMDNSINPAGWIEWNQTLTQLNTSYSAEYQNRGPGSNTSGRVISPGVHVLVNSTDAYNFTVASFLLGDVWLWRTGVPYISGLIS